MADEYRGQKAEPGQAPSDVPPPPSDVAEQIDGRPVEELTIVNVSHEETDEPALESRAGCHSGVVYSSITLTGNYGANFCQEFQSIELSDATPEEARSAGWSYFGMCRYSMRCSGPQDDD